MTPPIRPPSAPVPVIRPTIIAPQLVPEHQGTVAFLSHVRREGDWILPRNFRGVAALGNMELDLTCARIGSGTSRIEIAAVMGSVTILVPPELRVECDGEPLMGSFEIKRQVTSTASPDAPLVQISGNAFMGSVEVKIIDPNAPGWFEKLRARLLSKRV